MFPRTFAVLAFLCVVQETFCGSPSSMDRRPRGKKKVVIIGEMSDLAYDLATNSSNNYALSDVTFEDYDDFTSRNNKVRQRPVALRKRTGYMPSSSLESSDPGSVFVPVAAYSVTHSRVGEQGSSSGQVMRRSKPGKY